VIEFRLLGPLELETPDGPLPLGGARQRALLAILLLEAGRVVPTERLVDLLWGEDAPRTATTSLHNAVSALRKLLGAEAIETRPPGYLLRVDPAAVDARRFERLVTNRHEAPPAERAAALREALALWRGPALAEFAFEEWAQPEIRRLEELRLVAIEERVAADVELGRHGEAIPALETLSAEHPLRERPVELRLLALYAAGRQAEALQAYQDFRARLVEELGIEPGRALQELQRKILRQEAGLGSEGGVRADEDVEGEIVQALLAGRVVPVLGLGGSTQLAERLATVFDYPRDRPLDLARVCQYVATMRGSGPLYDELHDRFELAIEPGPLHRFLAALPPLLRQREAPHQLIVTTNYDLALEQAFEEAGEELDVVAYVAAGAHRGRFWHRPPGAAPRPVELPNEYAELSLDRRTVLLKLRGAVDLLPDREWESFVATEDDHIDYLGRAELASAVPVTLAARLRRSHFLFLGYELADWNLRLVLSRVWGDRAVAYGSWAIQPEATPLEQAFWRHHDVRVLDVEQDDLVRLLEGRLDAAAAA
jgi:DNA-binding SARP family transcriptional activator